MLCWQRLTQSMCTHGLMQEPTVLQSNRCSRCTHCLTRTSGVESNTMPQLPVLRT